MRRLAFNCRGHACCWSPRWRCCAWRSDAAPAPRGNSDKQTTKVDVELVLAVDISYSMDPDELALQREGYVKALTSREFLSALRDGIHGKIAVTYFEWAGAIEQKVVVPWRLIDGPECADAVAAEIAARRSAAPRAPRSRARCCSATPLFETAAIAASAASSTCRATAPTISGPLVSWRATRCCRKGITINGLPIMLKRPSFSTMDIDMLDIYYEDCVIGGPGAFVVPMSEREKFVEAIRTKLVLEIAGIVPASAASSRPPPTSRASPARSASASGRSAGAIDASALEPTDDLDMRCVAELIDRRDAREPVAAVDQNARRRAQRSRDCTRPRPRSGTLLCELARLRLGALARRVEHHRVEALEFLVRTAAAGTGRAAAPRPASGRTSRRPPAAAPRSRPRRCRPR